MYKKPELKIITFDTEDVILTSSASAAAGAENIDMVVTTPNDPVITPATITTY